MPGVRLRALHIGIVMRCYLAKLAVCIRELAYFNELQWLGDHFNAIVVRLGCEKLED